MVLHLSVTLSTWEQGMMSHLFWSHVPSKVSGVQRGSSVKRGGVSDQAGICPPSVCILLDDFLFIAKLNFETLNIKKTFSCTFQ